MDRRVREAVRRRRTHMKLTQQGLAAYARVSPGTIANLERGSGEPETATWERVCATLGWVWRDGHHAPVELLPAPVAQRLVSLSDEIGDRETEHHVRDLYVKLLIAVGDSTVGDGTIVLDMRQRYAQEFAVYIWPHLKLEDPVDAKVVEFLQDQGWSPDDVLRSESSLNREEESFLDQKLDMLLAEVAAGNKLLERTSRLVEDAQRFASLPLRVKNRLMTAEVADYSISSISAAPGMDVLHLLILDHHLPPGPITQNQTIDRWVASLAVMGYVLNTRLPAGLSWSAFTESVGAAINKLEQGDVQGEKEGRGED